MREGQGAETAGDVRARALSVVARALARGSVPTGTLAPRRVLELLHGRTRAR